MKGVQIGEKERIEIDAQVEKVLRGLGNPEPPIRLDDVRELLRLDRHYYSSTDDSVLREFISKVKIGAQQLFLRPTLILDVVKKASVSAFWIPDGKRILIDKELPEKKHRWAETHEVIHSITEWHKLFLFGDSTRELNPACHDQLEAEANYGAGQLLFVRGRFVQEARDMEMCMATVKVLSTRFENTMTSTLWRYVEQWGCSNRWWDWSLFIRTGFRTTTIRLHPANILLNLPLFGSGSVALPRWKFSTPYNNIVPMREGGHLARLK